MAAVSLVNEVKALGAALAAVVEALPPPTLDEFEPTKEDEDRASFLFELKLLYSLLSDLKRTGWQIAVERKGTRIKFARGPRARKANTSHFEISDAKEKYQVVQGTHITDIVGEPRAPDISLQRGDASETPRVGDVIAIWDAKLRGTSGLHSTARITDEEFARFLLVKELLGVPTVVGSEAPLRKFPPAFEVSGLITNGTEPSEPRNLLFLKGVSVVKEFMTVLDPMVPTRDEHIAHGAVLAVSATAP